MTPLVTRLWLGLGHGLGRQTSGGLRYDGTARHDGRHGYGG